MSNYLAAIWKCRYFWLAMVRMDLRTRYRRSVLGIGWSLLQPIAMTAVMCTVFCTLFNETLADYAPSLMAGFCFWNFITTATSQGCSCLFQGEKYIRQYPAPIAIYPLRAVLGASFHFLIALSLVLVLRIVMKGFDNIPALLIHLVPTLFLLFVLGWSLAILVSFATVYFPDTQNITEVGLQILFYATPIIYKPQMLIDKGLGWVVYLNPLAAYLQILRDPILYGVSPPVQAYLMAILTATVFAGMAAATLLQLQRKIIFQL